MSETSYTLRLCMQQPLMRVDEWYQRGLVSSAVVDEYCEWWSTTPGRTHTAQLCDGVIRLTRKPEVNA